MRTKAATLVFLFLAGCFYATAYAGPASYYCTSSGHCVAKIKRVNVNRGDISFTLQLPVAELDKLPCAAGASVVNFRLPPADEGNKRYRQMFKMVTLGATRQIPVELLVEGGTYDCQTYAIALSFQHGR